MLLLRRLLRLLRLLRLTSKEQTTKIEGVVPFGMAPFVVNNTKG